MNVLIIILATLTAMHAKAVMKRVANYFALKIALKNVRRIVKTVDVVMVAMMVSSF